MRAFIKNILLFTIMYFFSCTCQCKNLHFIYIDHEETTPIESLREKLKMIRTNNTASNDALIVYLSNENSPKIYCQNLDGFDTDITSPEAFDKIITDITESISSSINVSVDVNLILDLLSTCGFAKSPEDLGFDNITMDFYVGPELWQLGYNKSFVARLYFALEIPKLDQAKVKFNIFKPKGMKKVYEEGNAFGYLNVENLNNKILRQYE